MNVFQVISGGVARNQFLRENVGTIGLKYELECYYPPSHYCTDNGVMVAWAGIEILKTQIDKISSVGSTSAQKVNHDFEKNNSGSKMYMNYVNQNPNGWVISPSDLAQLEALEAKPKWPLCFNEDIWGSQYPREVQLKRWGMHTNTIL